MKKEVVIFDFDGVIVDSLDFSFEINKSHSPKLTRKEWEDMHLGNFYDAFKKHKISTVDDFYKEYESKIHHVFPIESMDKVIQSLHKKYRLTIVSGSPARIIDKYLNRYGLRDYFEAIVGNEYHLNKVEKFNKIKDLCNVSFGDCLQITDTVCDVKEGHLTGIESIAVTWGIFAKDVFKGEKTFAVVDAPEEITGAVDKFFGKGY
ncbi:MAG: HAD hydrolase-like protein [bacterium]|nr:HAD hydrolase-like protein [bacterium]